MKSTILLASALSLYVAAPAHAQLRAAAVTRFQDMDTDHNGEISRAEWRGNDRSFRNQDWNGDGKLSGDEIRAGARRGSRGAVETSGTQDRFVELDSNHDGWLTRAEWHGSPVVFDALDANGDGRLTHEEAIGSNAAAQNEFKSLDVNGDGAIARSEWQWNADAFDRLDANRDGRLTLREFDNTVAIVPPPQIAAPQQSATYRAGYSRGMTDGVQAGREDKPRGWDLEGQRELETADAGYEGRLGSLMEYQSGYRAGFRRGYAEGFGPRL